MFSRCHLARERLNCLVAMGDILLHQQSRCSGKIYREVRPEPPQRGLLATCGSRPVHAHGHQGQRRLPLDTDTVSTSAGHSKELRPQAKGTCEQARPWHTDQWRCDLHGCTNGENRELAKPVPRLLCVAHVQGPRVPKRSAEPALQIQAHLCVVLISIVQGYLLPGREDVTSRGSKPPHCPSSATRHDRPVSAPGAVCKCDSFSVGDAHEPTSCLHKNY